MIRRFIEPNNPSFHLNELQQSYIRLFSDALNAKIVRLEWRQLCLCGSDNVELIAAIDRFSLPFRSYICANCGLIFTSPYISEISLGQYYNTYYHPLTFGTLDENINLFSRDQGRKIFNWVRPFLMSKRVNVFEVGAGNGSNLREFGAAACNDNVECGLFGIEFNESFVAYGNNNGTKLASTKLSEYVECCKIKFDVIILSHVLEHFIDIGFQLDLLRRVSHKNTIIYIEVPGVLDLKNKFVYGYDFIRFLTHAHNFNFTKLSLIYVMSLYGYTLLAGNEKIESVFRYDPQFCSRDTAICAAGNKAEVVNYLQDIERMIGYYRLRAKFELFKSKVLTKLRYHLLRKDMK